MRWNRIDAPLRPAHVTMAMTLLFLSGCGGDAEDEGAAGEAAAEESMGDAHGDAADADGAADAGAAGPTPIREEEFAEELGIDLDEMEERESGLFVQVLEEGSGPAVAHGDQVGVHYTLWLTDGRKVDSSLDGNPPEPLLAVIGSPGWIRGWVEGVTGMRLGERRKLALPSELGYGAAGQAPDIAPHSILVFEVELVEHVPAGEG